MAEGSAAVIFVADSGNTFYLAFTKYRANRYFPARSFRFVLVVFINRLLLLGKEILYIRS